MGAAALARLGQRVGTTGAGGGEAEGAGRPTGREDDDEVEYHDMSTTARPIGFRHELLLHRSTAELVEFVVPFVRDGAAAEESTLLLVRPATARAVLDRVEPSPHLRVQPALAKPGRPAAHAHAAGPLLSGYARVLHEEPVIPRAQWSEWRRLEAALNVILRRHDTWAVCAYDRRRLSEDMVDDLNAAHPLLARDGSHRPNEGYREPRAFLDARPAR